MDIFIFLIFFIANCNANLINEAEYDKMPPLFKLDQYDSCLRQEDGVYCMLQLNLVSDTPNTVMEFIQEYSQYSATHFNHTYITRGVCVPTTCYEFISDKSMATQLYSILDFCMNESIWKDYGIQSKLSTIIYCDKYNEKSDYDFYDYMAMAIAIFIISLNIIGTSYDWGIKKHKRDVRNDVEENFLLCFSLMRNWKWLTKTEHEEKRLEQLKGLHCIKCILTFFVIMAHTSWINMSFTDNPLDFEKAYDTLYYRVIHGGMMLVQVFFVLSGFHLVNNLIHLSETLKVTWRMYPWIVLQRFLRLSPANVVMLLFTATWLRHLGSGPLWNLLISNSVVDHCRKHWWKHIIYLNNYDYEDRFCAVHTWSIAADFQLFLFGVAIFISATLRNKNVFMFLLLFVGSLIPALQVWLNDLDGVVVMRPEFFRTNINDTYWILHIRSHNNLPSYIVGMWTGYLAYELQRKKAKFSCNSIPRNIIWLVVPVFVCLFASCSFFYTDTDRASIIIRMAYASLQRVVVAGISAFLILALIFRFNSTLSNICEWPGWVVPSRLSYCVYLLHLNFVLIYLGIRTQLSHMSIYNFLVIVLGMTSLSLISSFPLYLLVEAPVTKFIKHMTNKTIKSKNNKKEQYHK